MKSGPLRDKTLSFAVTEKMYNLVKQKADQLKVTPSTLSYQIFLDFFEEELDEVESL